MSMNAKPSYEELEQQVQELRREAQRTQLAETAFYRQKSYLEALHETSLGLIDNLDKEELLEHILDQATSLTGTEHGFIYLREPDAESMQMLVGKGFFKGQLGRKVAIGEGFGGQVWQHDEPLLVENYQSWPGRIPDESLDKLRSIMGIPMKSKTRILGVIGLAHIDGHRSFTREDVMVLERFAALALLALEKAGLYTEVRRELSERQRTEAELRNSEARYRALLEASPDPIVVYDMQGKATYANPAFEQTFNMSRHEVLGKQIDFVPEENWPETKEAIEKMLAGQNIRLFETKRLTKDGRVLDVQISSRLYLGLDGKPAGNIVILRDISECKKAEKELQTYRDRLEKLVEERTAEFEKANQELKKQIEERKRAESALRKHQKELQTQSHHLEEVNTALRVLLKQREEDQQALMETMRRNIQELVSPYLEKALQGRLDPRQKSLLEIMETNLQNIVSNFINSLTEHCGSLTPMEIRVADMIKAGKTNSEISKLLLISQNTVLFHRYNIRTKLNIKNKKINLRSHLLAFQ